MEGGNEPPADLPTRPFPGVGVRFSGPAYHGYYELNEKEVNSVAAKTVDSSGYFQL